MCVCDAQRNSPVSAHSHTHQARGTAQPELRLRRRLFFYGSRILSCPAASPPVALGYAMLAQRIGLPPGCKPPPPIDRPDLPDADKTAAGCCSFSPAPGGCPWARLAGVDGCLSEPYCLWFQLLARAYWGEVELGLASPAHGASRARFKDACGRNRLRFRVRGRR